MKNNETLIQKIARLKGLREASSLQKPQRVRAVRVLGLADVLHFGKHHGRTLQEVIDVTYMRENFDDLELTPDAEAAREATDDPRAPR